MAKSLLVLLVILFVGGCTTARDLTSISQLKLAHDVSPGKKVRITSSSGTSTLVKVKALNDDHILSEDGAKYPYSDIQSITVKDFTPWNVLVYPLIPVYYAVSIVAGVILLPIVAICGDACNGIFSS